MTTVLVINSGSSSMKYQLVEVESGRALATGIVERIGDDGARAVHESGGVKSEHVGQIADLEAERRDVVTLAAELHKAGDPERDPGELWLGLATGGPLAPRL